MIKLRVILLPLDKVLLVCDKIYNLFGTFLQMDSITTGHIIKILFKNNSNVHYADLSLIRRQNVVSNAAVLCVVTQHSSLGGALRNNTKNGCIRDQQTCDLTRIVPATMVLQRTLVLKVVIKLIFLT